MALDDISDYILKFYANIYDPVALNYNIPNIPLLKKTVIPGYVILIAVI